MKLLSVIVPRDRTGLVESAFDEAGVVLAGVGQTRVAGLGTPPRLRHHGRSYEDERCVRLDAVVSDDQASAVASLLRASCGPQAYLLWSLPIDGMGPPAKEAATPSTSVGSR